MQTTKIILLLTLITGMKAHSAPQENTPSRDRQLTVSQVSPLQSPDVLAIKVAHKSEFNNDTCLQEGVEIITKNNKLMSTRPARYVNPYIASARDCEKSVGDDFIQYVGNMSSHELPKQLKVINKKIDLYCNGELEVSGMDKRQRVSACSTKELTKIIGYDKNDGLELRLIFDYADNRSMSALLILKGDRLTFDMAELMH